jgi:hypothetical protein
MKNIIITIAATTILTSAIVIFLPKLVPALK